ncbi:MAG: response regulator, partial [Methylococcales bacterium]
MEVDLSKKSFLIVDDHQAMRNGIAEMLYSSGADDVDKAMRGDEAITRLKERRYDAVLCDYNLGKGK